MAQIHPCEDSSDAVTLYPVLGLYLKPIARIYISIHYPALKNSLSNGGKSVSSWELMEKIKALTVPDHFIQLKIIKNTLEFIRFEGDLENRDILKSISTRLEGKALKLTGFKEPFKVRTSEAKVPFPSKYDWDSYFRDAKHMNEMKAGERPDTIHFQHLPSKWFSQRKNEEKPIPSEKLFRRVWEIFGEIRSVDIPMLDPYRQKMNSSIPGIKTFTFNIDSVFEAYVQYKDYMSFVKAMDALRGMFLLYQENNKHWVASIKVDFDKSKHLSDDSARKRQLERDRLMNAEKDEQFAKLKALRELQSSKPVKNKEENSIFDSEDEEKNSIELERKIKLEEKKYVIARRKLEAIRLIDYLFEVVKIKLELKKKSKKLKRKAETKKLKKKKKRDQQEENYSSDKHTEISDGYDSVEEKGRSKRFTEVIGRYKEIHEYKVEQQEEKLRRVRPSESRVRKSPTNSYHSPERRHRNYSSEGNGHYDDDGQRKRRRSNSIQLNHNNIPSSTRYLNDWEIGVKQNSNDRRPDRPAQNFSNHYRKPPLLPDPVCPPFPQRPNDNFRFSPRGRGGYNPRYRGSYRPYSVSHSRNHPQNQDFQEHSYNSREYSSAEKPYHQPDRSYDYDDNSAPAPPSYQEELEQAYEKYFKSITLRNEEESHKIKNEERDADQDADDMESVAKPSKHVKSKKKKTRKE